MLKEGRRRNSLERYIRNVSITKYTLMSEKIYCLKRQMIDKYSGHQDREFKPSRVH